jgi:formylglycine-generating enzyme required for sulfatase activity
VVSGQRADGELRWLIGKVIELGRAAADQAEFRAWADELRPRLTSIVEVDATGELSWPLTAAERAARLLYSDGTTAYDGVTAELGSVERRLRGLPAGQVEAPPEDERPRAHPEARPLPNHGDQWVSIDGDSNAPIVNAPGGFVSLGVRHDLRAELDDYAAYLVAVSLGIRREHARPEIVTQISSALDALLAYQEAADGERWSPDLDARLDAQAIKAYEALDRASRASLGMGYRAARPEKSVAPFPDFDLFRDMVLVRAGTDFLTGRSVGAFYMSRHPVTVVQYAEFCRTTGWAPPHGWSADGFPRHLADHPVTGVTLLDALIFCVWLEAATSFRFRLPTEAEWCFAATRGQEQAYPWGKRYEPGQGVTSLEARSTRPVGTATGEAPGGLRDLSGNVWELTATLYDETPTADMDCEFPPIAGAMARPEWWGADARIGHEPGGWFEAARFVMHGGSWGGGPEWATVDQRIWTSAMNYGAYGGFRVVCSAEELRGGHMPAPSFLIADGDHWVQKIRLSAGDESHAELERTFSACGGGITGRHDIGDQLLRQALRRYNFAEDDRSYYARVGIAQEVADAVSGHSLAERALRRDDRFPDLRPRY